MDTQALVRARNSILLAIQHIFTTGTGAFWPPKKNTEVRPLKQRGKGYNTVQVFGTHALVLDIGC